jgi:hypothetical protein
MFVMRIGVGVWRSLAESVRLFADIRLFPAFAARYRPRDLQHGYLRRDGLAFMLAASSSGLTASRPEYVLPIVGGGPLLAARFLHRRMPASLSHCCFSRVAEPPRRGAGAGKREVPIRDVLRYLAQASHHVWLSQYWRRYPRDHGLWRRWPGSRASHSTPSLEPGVTGEVIGFLALFGALGKRERRVLGRLHRQARVTPMPVCARSSSRPCSQCPSRRVISWSQIRFFPLPCSRRRIYWSDDFRVAPAALMESRAGRACVDKLRRFNAFGNQFIGWVLDRRRSR